MRDRIKELNTLQAKVSTLEESIKSEIVPRLELFCTAMSAVEYQDPDKKVWSKSKYPHKLTDDNYSTFTVELTAVEDDRMVISWHEEEYCSGQADSRGSQFSVHNKLFTEDHESYIRTRVKEFQQEVDVIVEAHKQKQVEIKQKKIDALQREIQKI